MATTFKTQDLFAKVSAQISALSVSTHKEYRDCSTFQFVRLCDLIMNNRSRKGKVSATLELSLLSNELDNKLLECGLLVKKCGRIWGSLPADSHSVDISLAISSTEE